MNRLVALSWHIHEPLSGLVMIPKAGFFPAVPKQPPSCAVYTQLRVGLGFASPTLLNPLPHLGEREG
jgi:hypothetical protein